MSDCEPLHLYENVDPLNAELNPMCHLLALAGAHHFVHVSRLRVNSRNSNSNVRIIIFANVFFLS